MAGGRETGQRTNNRKQEPNKSILDVPNRQRLNSKRSFEEIDDEKDGADVVDTEKPWIEPKPRRRKVNYGKAKIESKRSDEAVAPFEVLIANTHPLSTKELIGELLIECAGVDEARTSPLEIIEVKCMTNKAKIPNPRTTSLCTS